MAPATDGAAGLSTPLRGRDAEQQLIDAMLGDAHRQGRFVIVEGPPGIGKSRLVDWAVHAARAHHFQVASGAAHPLERGRPFAALLDALDCYRDSSDARRSEIGRLAGSVAREPDAFTMAAEAVGRFAVQDAIVELVVDLAEREGPLLLAVDDVHCADDATFAAIAAIAHRLPNVPLVVIVAARTYPRTAPLDTLLDRLEPRPLVLTLGPLDPETITTLATDALGRAPTVGERSSLDRAGGSPLLLSMMMAGGALAADLGGDAFPGDVTRDIRAATLHLVSFLPAETREVLDVAAAVGEPVVPEVLAPLVGRPLGTVVTEIERAVRMGTLEEREGALWFRHDIVREALYDELPGPVRVAVHRDIWRHLEASGASPLAVARHVYVAARPGEHHAIDLLRSAAEGMMRTEPAEALDLLERAQGLAPAGSGAWLGVAADRVRAFVWAGRLRDAETSAREALTRAAGRAEASELHRVLAICLLRQGNFPAAEIAVEDAIRVGVPPAAEARLHAELATMRLWAFDGRGADDEALLALDYAARTGATDAAVQALNIQSMAAGLRGDVGRGVTLAQKAVERGRELGTRTRPSPALYLGIALLNADRLEEAARELDAGRRHCEAERDPFMEGRFAGAQAIVAWLRGGFDEMASGAAAVERIAADTGSGAGLPLAPAIAGLAAFHQDDVAASRVALARARTLADRPEADRAGLPFVALLEATLAAHDGRWAAAHRALAEHLDFAAALAVFVPLWVGTDAVRAAVAAGDHDRATTTAALLATIAQRVATPTASALAALAGTLAAGDPEGIATAAGQIATTERAFEAARAAEDAGLAMRAAGLSESSSAWLADASARYRQLGATRDIDRVANAIDSRLPDGTNTRSVPKASGWSSLSAEDEAVADLVAAGLANKEIADRLFMSKRTVEWHVSRLYTRLAAPNRVALSRVVQDHHSGGEGAAPRTQA